MEDLLDQTVVVNKATLHSPLISLPDKCSSACSVDSDQYIFNPLTPRRGEGTRGEEGREGRGRGREREREERERERARERERERGERKRERGREGGGGERFQKEREREVPEKETERAVT